VLRARGLRISRPGGPARLEPVELPAPRGREVLVGVAAAGLCQSDLHVIDAPTAALAAAMPFTLGHEIAGTVTMVGDDVETVRVGDPVAVYGPWGCGDCPRCRAGSENYCLHRDRLGYAGAGLGRDGGIADAVLIPHERQLLPLAGLDPVQAAPLTDAGLTSYQAVRLIAPRLPADPVVAVVGVGGLGHLAIQLLRAVTASTVLAVDSRGPALELARRCGAQLTVPAAAGAAGVRAATGGAGVDAVLDLVGAPGTVDLAASVLRPGGDLVIVGSGGGQLLLAKGTPELPVGVRAALPFWGSRPELEQVLELARGGALRVEVETFPLARAGEAVARLRAGTIDGRAVVVPR
jgi:propanol-preferring alcohol dehydrogenase